MSGNSCLRLLVAASLYFALPLPDAAAAETNPSAEPVELLRIDDVREFPDATEPGAVQYACADQASRLEAFFAAKRLPFEKDLVRRYKGRKACHIHYEPTLAGFRALTDDRPITGLIGGIEPSSFVANRSPSGDSLDVVKAVLARISKPLDVTLSIVDDYGDQHWPEALERHFPDTHHRIKLIRSFAEDSHPWGQDFVKAGQVDGELRLLTTRRLYEGRATDGNRFLPLLDAFSDDHFARSKLSWEGGDIQLARDPRDPSKTILFYGSAVRDYWGAELRPREFGWVLQVELGADSVVDISHIGPHTDYLVAFTPEVGLALVAEPVRKDMALARATLNELKRVYGRRAAAEIDAALGALTRWEIGGHADSLAELLQRAESLRNSLPLLPLDADRRTLVELEAYLAANCPEAPEKCFDKQGRRKLFESEPDLTRRVLDMKTSQESEDRTPWQMLGLLETQLNPGVGSKVDDQLNRLAQQLKNLGFKVVRIPYVHPDSQVPPWPGIGYINMLAVEKALLVPEYGLGKPEQGYFDLIRNRLPGYEVIPIPARMSLVSNGGVHCVFSIVREP